MWITQLFSTMRQFHPHFYRAAKALSTPEKQDQIIDFI
jgi:hypothetical protein